MSKNFIFEIGIEELPANVITNALSEMEKIFKELMAEAMLSYELVKTAGTPRRLMIFAENLPEKQIDRTIELMGPPAKIALNSDGALTKAGEGFLKNQELSREDILIKETEKGQYLSATKHLKGRLTIDILSELLPKLIKLIPFPKNMRWEESQFRFPRPVRWLLAIFDGDIIPFEIAGIKSDKITFGHRLSNPKFCAIAPDFDHYTHSLRDLNVIVDIEERKNIIINGANEEAKKVNGRPILDEDLINLNTFLAEYPSALLGDFEKDFLRIPEDVLITSMKEHQKFFAARDANGKLLPHFIAVLNTISPDKTQVKAGLERVLRARLSDAAFFYDADRKTDLSHLVPKLKGVVYHQKLGTILDKTNRIIDISGYLAENIDKNLIEKVQRAAWLCKADLLTQMVGEFPTLQGIMGMEYSKLSGEDHYVSLAIKEHYMPTHSGGELPETIPGAILSISDKIDTITGIFVAGQPPTGAQDPFGLRRATLGILNIILQKELTISLNGLIQRAIDNFKDQNQLDTSQKVFDDIYNFIKKRLEGEFTGRGFKIDCVDAVLRVDIDNPVSCLKKIETISYFRERQEFKDLSIAFKRVMNILKDFNGGNVDSARLIEDAEKTLYSRFSEIRNDVNVNFEKNDYIKSLELLISLKPDIDSFFDTVMVMVDDKDIKNNRLSILWEISREFLKVGDISAIAPR